MKRPLELASVDDENENENDINNDDDNDDGNNNAGVVVAPSEPRKRQHVYDSSEFIDLPEDIINQVLSKLTKTDILHLSMTDSRHRQQFKPRIFNKIRASWWKLIEDIELDDSFLHHNRRYIYELHVVDAYPNGEWNIDLFEDVLSYLPHLCCLKINSVNSSSWLKYRSNDCIQKLTLYGDSTNRESELKLHPQTNRRHSHPPSKNIKKLFSMEDISNFKMLKILKLSDYEFNCRFDNATFPVIMLETLDLTDCTWNYPFSLSHFNYNQSVKHLRLRFSPSNSFLLSERYHQFLAFRDKGLASLTSLTIQFLTSVEPREITRESFDDIFRISELQEPIMMSLLHSDNFPNLHSIKFSNWRLAMGGNSRDLSWLENCLKDSRHLKVFEFKVYGSMRFFYTIVDPQYFQNRCRLSNPDKKIVIKFVAP
ncbi:uncharacterized protein LODBEIA_P22940 [Lodderomyces beijingensis]|uniref:F-box domain-containing protein n=1 Tax=Lodderomyces beijingensis TaxID=1775926 RepID=A0ABP0ZPC4_9ASCO